MITLLSFGDTRYTKSQQRLLKSAFKFGINKAILKNQNDLFREHRKFIEENQYTLRQKRGYGYWIWKPYLIDQALKNHIDEGELLFWCDSGVEILAPLQILIEKMEGDILAFHIDHKNEEHVKMKIYVEMGVSDDEIQSYKDATQCAAGYAFYRNSELSRKFVREWLELCTTPFLIDDTPTPTLRELPRFKENRHDQAIFSMLVHKYGIQTLRDPSQWGNKSDDRDFEQIFLLHRKRSHPWFKKEKIPFQHIWNQINN